MTPRERTSLAEQLKSNPLLNIVLDELEKAAMEQAIYAPYDNHEKRQAYLAEVRAIRAFRSNLTTKLWDNASKKDA
jgi:hypothetical protein